MSNRTCIGNTLRDISDSRNLFRAEKESLRQIAKEYDNLEAEAGRLTECLNEIESVSCGESQVAEDDSEGMGWIYKRIQALGLDGKKESRGTESRLPSKEKL